MSGRRAVGLVLTDAERAELDGLASWRSTAQGFALRARIVLACAEGAQYKRKRRAANRLACGMAR